MSRKKVLLTGGTGFVGRNVLPILRERFEVDAPRRSELNLLDDDAVRRFITQGGYDVVIHSANSTPAKNPLDKADRLFADSLRAYFNIRRCASHFEKMLYVGSGAEYDKRYSIVSVSEEAIGRSLPVDDYGFAKFIMNEDARQSTNVINLRIFGCYGPTDSKSKFIRDAIDCCLANHAITIRQDCMFDYLYVTDLGRVMALFAENECRYHDYNICSGKRVALSEIAKIVAKQMGNTKHIEIAKPGLNREYTASNRRFMIEYPEFGFVSLEAGIARQIEWQKGYIQ